MSSFDVDAAIRWMRGFPTKTLARRNDEELPFIDNESLGGQPVLLDTCVYIDRLKGDIPDHLRDILRARLNHHSSTAIQELAHTIGVLDPADTRTASVHKAVSDVITAMPSHRVITADIDVLGRAAILNGIICRIQGYNNDQKFRSLNDCTIFLQALKYGLVLITRNISDFDYCLQLIPTGRVLFYRT
ncbi:type II toxin-antitoxin system VapC family toxin [Ochrobactrum sp. BTU1]|uniref:type II toxin-antitoxin system VapC family toxin n=1 Tax=Ochrobactrum sp. BTU1 TaxID=2840456 RepID=UPI001C04155A|nr:DNA-binding protein [Ochrobactrum sp. BTU1]